MRIRSRAPQNELRAGRNSLRAGRNKLGAGMEMIPFASYNCFRTSFPFAILNKNRRDSDSTHGPLDYKSVALSVALSWLDDKCCLKQVSYTYVRARRVLPRRRSYVRVESVKATRAASLSFSAWGYATLRPTLRRRDWRRGLP